jgi:hypothetical protein
VVDGGEAELPPGEEQRVEEFVHDFPFAARNEAVFYTL